MYRVQFCPICKMHHPGVKLDFWRSAAKLLGSTSNHRHLTDHLLAAKTAIERPYEHQRYVNIRICSICISLEELGLGHSLTLPTPICYMIQQKAHFDWPPSTSLREMYPYLFLRLQHTYSL